MNDKMRLKRHFSTVRVVLRKMEGWFILKKKKLHFGFKSLKIKKLNINDSH